MRERLILVCIILSILGLLVAGVAVLAWLTPLTFGQSAGWTFLVLLAAFLVLMVVAVFNA